MMSKQEALDNLIREYGDSVSVHKAFQMLGSRNQISPVVSTYQNEHNFA